MKALVLALALSMMTLSAAPLLADAAERPLTARSFQFKHKDPDRAAAAIRPLLSNAGSVSIHSGTRTLVVTDRPDVLQSVAAALERFDLPGQTFRLDIKLVSASRGPGTARVPEELREISSKLSGVLRFNSFEKVGEMAATADESSQMLIEQLAPGYRAEFRLGEYDPATDTIRVNEFRLHRAENGQLVQLLRTTLNLKLGQMSIIGASKVPNSDRALMLVLQAERQ